MTRKIIFHNTHATNDPERATLPFIAANVAATAGQEAIVFCTIDAVWLGTKGGPDAIVAKGIPALAQVYRDFVANGGKVWLCGVCTKPRGITEDHLAEGATIVGAAKLVEEVVKGAATVTLA